MSFEAKVAVTGALDWAIVVAYFAVLAVIVVYVNSRAGSSNSVAFFLGGRSIPWWAVGCSIYASNEGTDHLVGLAGSSAKFGLVVGLWEWSAIFVLGLLGWAFVPRYFAENVKTVPEFIEHVYGRKVKMFILVQTLVATFLTKITVVLYGGSLVLYEILEMNQYVSCVVILGLTCVYATAGGLRAVMFTEVFQALVLVVGCVALIIFAMAKVGGWGELQQEVDAYYLTLWKPLRDPDYPWPGFGAMLITGIWYWCCDQVIVQRALGTDQVSEAQRGIVLAAGAKILPMYLMCLPGVLAFVLYPDEVGTDWDASFAILVKNVLPSGWIGVMLAAMVSSFMSALASSFNSCSTIFTLDVYKEFYPDSSEEQLVRAGRWSTVFVAIFSVLWVPLISIIDDTMFDYIMGVSAIWSPSIAVVFVAALVSDRVDATSALVTLVVGNLIGLGFFIVNTLLASLSLSGVFKVMQDLNYLLFAEMLFCGCAFLMYACIVVQEKLRTSERDPLLGVPVRDAIISRACHQNWSGAGTVTCFAAIIFTVILLWILHSTIWD